MATRNTPDFHLIHRLISIITLAFVVSSCMKREEFPIIPQIAYEGFRLEFDSGDYARRGYLTISFKDGDGDIGLHPYQKSPPFDTGSIYYYNYIIDYFEQRNGVFTRVDLNPSFNARIPYLTPDDPNKAIKGIIVDTLPLNPAPQYDTVKFRFYIYDRALHRSNIDSTPPIILRKR